MRTGLRPTILALATVIMLAVLLIVALNGSAATSPRALQKTTRGEIEALAMTGSLVAYDVGARYGAKQRCNTVNVWNVRRGTTTRVSGPGTCGADSTSTGAGVRELALAGGRAAWIVNQGGNSESDDYLYVSVLAQPRERVVTSAIRTGDVGGVLTGNWIGGLVGAGSFLAVNQWATDSQGAVTTAHLQSVGPRLHGLSDGSDTLTARSTDGRQVAVLRSDGTVGLYSTRGALLRVVTPGPPAELALRGDFLVVLTTTRTLEVYNSHSGRRLHAWRAPAGAAHLDVSNGYAAYAVSRTVRLTRLSTGARRTVARAGSRVSALQLEPAGLAYAVERPHDSGAVVFVPMSRLAR